MDKATDIIISKYVQSVAERYKGFVAAYLFGSYIRTSFGPDSDIDVALIFDEINNPDRFDLQVQLMLLASEYDLRIEPHPISGEDFANGNPFIMEIKKTGRKIESSPSEAAGT